MGEIFLTVSYCGQTATELTKKPIRLNLRTSRDESAIERARMNHYWTKPGCYCWWFSKCFPTNSRNRGTWRRPKDNQQKRIWTIYGSVKFTSEDAMSPHQAISSAVAHPILRAPHPRCQVRSITMETGESPDNAAIKKPYPPFHSKSVKNLLLVPG